MRCLKVVILILATLFPCSLWAATYYVGPPPAWGTWGTAAGNCGEAGGAGRSNPCGILQTHGAATSPGDTIYLMDGTYDLEVAGMIGGTDAGGDRSSSGSAGNYITYEGEAGATVVFRKDTKAGLINLAGLSYIKLKNITVTSPQSYGIDLRDSANHITIENCILNAIGTGDSTWAFIYGVGANNNIIIRNNIINGGSAGAPTHADLVYFVIPASETVEYILMEGNTFNEGGSHASVEFQAGAGVMRNIVIRNNSIQNKNHTALNMYGSPSKASNVLVENNIIRDGGSICSLDSCQENTLGSVGDRAQRRDQKPNFQFMTTDTIVRHNRSFNGGKGLGLHPSSSTVEKNRFYNNTFYGNCVGIDVPNWGYDVTDNVFLNNVLKDNTATSSQTNYPIYFSLQSSTNYAVGFGYNYVDDANDSYYRDPSQIKTGTMTQLNADPGGTIFYGNVSGSVLMVNPVAYDFHLQSGSPAIGAAGPLTTVAAADTSSGTSLVVTDAKFFQDGTWGPTGEVSADWICVGATVAAAECMQLSAINYSTNTITVADFTREDGDNVWLYKNSNGVQVLYGSAPDIGAFEFAGFTHQMPTGTLSFPAAGGKWQY